MTAHVPIGPGMLFETRENFLAHMIQQRDHRLLCVKCVKRPGTSHCESKKMLKNMCQLENELNCKYQEDYPKTRFDINA